MHAMGMSERGIAKKIRKFKKSMIHVIITHMAKNIK
jgi:hypothetical protein